MPSYEKEHCDSCRYYLDVDFCANTKVDRDEWPDLADCCELFGPSLECRKVLALEKLADLTGCLRDDGRGGYTFDVTK